MIEEFEQRTGFFPSQALYEVIERYYVKFPGGKDAFCQAYRENAGGLAYRIQREADREAAQAEIGHCQELLCRDGKILKLEKELEREQEWKPYEIPDNVSQADYERTAQVTEAGNACVHMSDAEAVKWICGEFGFDPNKITIIREIDEHEISRHQQIRRTGRKMDRSPVYCATDCNYIRFNVSHWKYEAWDGQLRPFYD